MNARRNQGFSTILAMLVTAFLTVLSAGILDLFLNEYKLHRIVYEGITTRTAAEWAIEYELLKIKNHRVGFDDLINKEDQESSLLGNPASPKIPTIGITSKNNGKSWSGSIPANSFLIFPLFADTGSLIQINAKNPNTEAPHFTQVTNFELTPEGDITWNLIAMNPDGTTEGITGTGWFSSVIGSGASATITSGNRKFFDTSVDRLQDMRQDINNFLMNHPKTYLIVYNPGTQEVKANLSADDLFSFPGIHIAASARLGSSELHVEFNRVNSLLLETLKYSLYNQ